MAALPLPYSNVLGCNACGTRWSAPAADQAAATCWMCGHPGKEFPRPGLGDGGERAGAAGMYADIVAAKQRGPDRLSDPCGSGPL
jgi:hypothetical protein